MSDRLHMGCGTVYLYGYVNIDLPAPRCHLAEDNLDLMMRYATREDRYYANHAAVTPDTFRTGPLEADYVCDRYGRWDAIPCRDGDACEVLGRATFEHLSQTEAHRALEEVRRVLLRGGLLRLSVPDHAATLAGFVESRDPLAIRYLLGPRNSPGGYHLQSYTLEALRGVVEAHGFEWNGEEPSPHLYPMICGTWVRS